MSTIQAHRTNYQQLLAFKDIFLANSKHMSSLGKYISFGPLSVSRFIKSELTFSGLDLTQRHIFVARFIQ